MRLKKLGVLILSLGVAGVALVANSTAAKACGCFAPPDPSVPIVQAGENILFGVEDGIVTAHIQVQYAGPAAEFGWLLPLPSMPVMTLGSDELFAQLLATTQPKYVLDAEYHGDCPFDPSRNGGFAGNPSSDGADSGEDSDGGGSPLVLEDSIGPYDYAILRADSKQPMLDWLNENGYFIPVGTDDVVGPYIREGAFFLALRLKKGNDLGDLQPVVLEYPSDLPMIPIILTGVAANPDMGVQVWVLGEARAIPRNYFHTKINDAQIDWVNFGANYVEVVTRAVDDAEGHHSFVTEYAGTSSVMVDVLDPSWRFGDMDTLRTLGDAVEYINFVNNHGFPVPQQAPPFGFQYPSQTLAILQRHLPMPVALSRKGITPNDYYSNFSYYVGTDRFERPWLYNQLDLEFDPVVMTGELEQRVVEPARAAGALFRKHSYLTRMFTTLSPEEMTRDPVFSFNPDLPTVSNEHRGRVVYYCDASTTEQGSTRATIITEAGFILKLPNGTDQNPWLGVDMPSSHFTEALREEGDEQVVTDNTAAILAAINKENDRGGCSIGGVGTSLPIGLSMVGLLAVGVIRRRRGR